MGTMYVPVFKGQGRLTYEERPVPKPERPGDVLVRIEASGICGTDLNILATPPAHKANSNIIIGHEGTGIVESVAPGTSSIQAGDRVVIAPRITCGLCHYCRMGLDNQCTEYRTIGTTIDGVFAPYLCAPEQALFKISDNVSRDDAVLFEPLSCVVGSLARAPLQAGDDVIVIGAGPMGLLIALLYRTLGAGKIIVADVAPYRLEFANSIGVDEVLNPLQIDLFETVRQLTIHGADIVVDAVGNQMGTAVKLARRGGQIILFGLQPHGDRLVDQYLITRYDLTIYGTFVGLNPFEQTIHLLESGQLKPSVLITHRVPLSELNRGLKLMRDREAMKVLVEN